MKRKTHMASHAKMVIIKLNLGESTATDFEFRFCGVYHVLPMGVSLRGPRCKDRVYLGVYRRLWQPQQHWSTQRPWLVVKLEKPPTLTLNPQPRGSTHLVVKLEEPRKDHMGSRGEICPLSFLHSAEVIAPII